MNVPPKASLLETRRPSKWGRVVAGALLVGAALLVTLVALMKPASPDTTPTPTPPVNVAVQRVETQAELADTLELTAVVEPERTVRVSAEVAGRIERYGRRVRDVTWQGQTLASGSVLAEGEPVQAGDPIVHLNADLLQARRERAAAQFQYDQREFERIQGLYERGSTSQTELDDAGTRRDVSKASLDEASRELERATIVAPIAGILNRLPMEVGEFPSPGDQVAEIVDLEKVKVVVDVPERDVPYLKIGDAAPIVARNTEQFELTGNITYINALAHEATRTTRIEITVPNPDHRLRSGQIVHARLTRRMLSNVIMIPLASVIPLENGKEVYIVRDGHAERREVELGFIRGRDVRVTRGLEPGDLLIVAGHRQVGPGQSVAVIAGEGNAP